MHWLIQHIQWFFDVLKLALGWKKSPNPSASSITAQGGTVTDSAVASGTNISQKINSPTTINLSLPAPTSGTPGRERYDEWRELIDEIHESIDQMGWAFVPVVAYKAGDERCDYKAGIRRGNRVLGNRILIAEAIQKSGLKKDWDELAQYTYAGHGPRDYWQQGSPTMGGWENKAHAFQEKLMRAARDDVDVSADPQPVFQPLENSGSTMADQFHSISRMIDSGSGEERKQIWEQRPDIVLEWTPGTRGNRDKGTFRNIGKRSGFSITTGSFSWPELQFTVPVQVNAIHPDKEVTVELPVVEKTGPNSMLIGSLDSFMRDQKFKERDDLRLTITFSDSEGHLFEREFVFRAGPGGSFGPLVKTSLGSLRQL